MWGPWFMNNFFMELVVSYYSEIYAHWAVATWFLILIVHPNIKRTQISRLASMAYKLSKYCIDSVLIKKIINVQILLSSFIVCLLFITFCLSFLCMLSGTSETRVFDERSPSGNDYLSEVTNIILCCHLFFHVMVMLWIFFLLRNLSLCYEALLF